MVKILKPFLHEGKIVHPGDPIKVDAARHAELARNGLVEPPTGKQARRAPAAKPAAEAKPAVSRRRALTGSKAEG